jgi:hypothetical protein
MLTDADGFATGAGRSGLEFMLNAPSTRTDPEFSYRHGSICTGVRAALVGYPNRNASVVALTNRDRTQLGNQITAAARSTYNG